MADDVQDDGADAAPGVDRRSFLVRVAGGVLTLGASAGFVAAVTASAQQPGKAQQRSGFTDQDNRDTRRNGRGLPNARRTNINDDDPTDRDGWGRGAPRPALRGQSFLYDRTDPSDGVKKKR